MTVRAYLVAHFRQTPGEPPRWRFERFGVHDKPDPTLGSKCRPIDQATRALLWAEAATLEDARKALARGRDNSRVRAALRRFLRPFRSAPGAALGRVVAGRVGLRGEWIPAGLKGSCIAVTTGEGDINPKSPGLFKS